MRSAVVFAIVALAAAACGMMYLFLERPRPPEPPRAPQEASIADSDALTTALDRLTEEVRELRAMLRERGDLARDSGTAPRAHPLRAAAGSPRKPAEARPARGDLPNPRRR